MKMSPEEKTEIVLNAISSGRALLVTLIFVSTVRSVNPKQTEEFKFVPLGFHQDSFEMTGYRIVNNMPLAMDIHIDQIINLTLVSASDD